MNAEKYLHQLKIAAIFFLMTLAVAGAGLFFLRSARITDYTVYGNRMYWMMRSLVLRPES